MTLRKFAGAGLLAALATLLPGCSGTGPGHYANETPALKLPEYFNGTVDAWGLVTDRSGRVIKRFKVVMQCRWSVVDGVETGTLEEQFIYSDGTRQDRTWTFRATGPNQYVGTAGDVVGEAHGSVSGNALQLQYTLALPVDGRVWHVQFDDWMFLMEDGVLLNRAAMSKLGVHVGDITVSFRRRDS